MSDDYTYTRDELAKLIIARHFPEKTDQEFELLLNYLERHADEFEKFSFSVRIGAGVDTDPAHLPAVQAALARSTMKRIDFVGWFGNQATLVEAKTTLSHQVLGQLLSDRALWVQQYADGPEPRLVAIGRRGTPQDLEILSSHGIDTYIYETANVS